MRTFLVWCWLCVPVWGQVVLERSANFYAPSRTQVQLNWYRWQRYGGYPGYGYPVVRRWEWEYRYSPGLQLYIDTGWPSVSRDW